MNAIAAGLVALTVGCTEVPPVKVYDTQTFTFDGQSRQVKRVVVNYRSSPDCVALKKEYGPGGTGYIAFDNMTRILQDAKLKGMQGLRYDRLGVGSLDRENAYLLDPLVFEVPQELYSRTELESLGKRLYDDACAKDSS